MKKNRTIFLLTLFFSCFNIIQAQGLEIDLSDSNFSLAYRVHYKVKNDSVRLTYYSGLEDRSVVQIGKYLLEDSSKIELIFLAKKIINGNLPNSYRLLCADDGDQKFIMIRFDKDQHSISLSNYYLEDVGKIIGLINLSILNADHKISYDKKSLSLLLKLCTEGRSNKAVEIGFNE